MLEAGGKRSVTNCKSFLACTMPCLIFESDADVIFARLLTLGEDGTVLITGVEAVDLCLLCVRGAS